MSLNSILGLLLLLPVVGGCQSPPVRDHHAVPGSGHVSPCLGEAEAASRLARTLAPLLRELEEDASLADDLLLTVEADEAVSPSLVGAIGAALDRRRVRLVAGEPWLPQVDRVQARQQTVVYAPRPRRPLEPASVALVLKQSSASATRVSIDALLVALQPVVDRAGHRHPPGATIPGSALRLSLCVTGSVGDAGPVIGGEGYCNRSLPPERWRYSAVQAAELDARARYLRLNGGGSVGFDQRLMDGGLMVDERVQRVAGAASRLRRVHVAFDPGRCRARVRLQRITSSSQESPQ